MNVTFFSLYFKNFRTNIVYPYSSLNPKITHVLQVCHIEHPHRSFHSTGLHDPKTSSYIFERIHEIRFAQTFPLTIFSHIALVAKWQITSLDTHTFTPHGGVFFGQRNSQHISIFLSPTHTHTHNATRPFCEVTRF